jgi:hypothetical protein
LTGPGVDIVAPNEAELTMGRLIFLLVAAAVVAAVLWEKHFRDDQRATH